MLVSNLVETKHEMLKMYIKTAKNCSVKKRFSTSAKTIT